MRRITRTILWAAIFGSLNLSGQAQDSLSQKLAADQTFAPESGVPVLTVKEAIAQAIANNSSLRIADLEIRKAANDATRIRPLANTQVIGLGGQPLTQPSVTFQQESLGVYP